MSLNSRLSNFGEKLQHQVIEGRLYPGYQIAEDISVAADMTESFGEVVKADPDC